MDKNLHDIEDLFRSALDQHEELPPKNVWDAVDNRLDKETVATIKKKYKTLKRLSLLLLLLLSGISIFELNQHYSQSNDVITKNIATNPVAFSDKTGANPEKQTKKAPARVPEEDDSKQITDAIASATTDRSTSDKTIVLNNRQSNNESVISNKKENQKRIPVLKTNFDAGSFSLTKKDAAFIKRSVTQKPNTAEQREIIETLLIQKKWPLPDIQSAENKLMFSYIQKVSSLIIDTTAQKKLYQLLALNKINIPIALSIAEAPRQKKKPPTQSEFSITGFFSPVLAAYRLEDENVPNQPENSLLIKKSERHEFSYTSGILVGYALNNKFTLQSGITFSNTNIAVEPKTIYAQIVSTGDVKYRLNLSSGYGYLVPGFQPSPAVGDSITVTSTVHKLRYIGVPIGLKYIITNGKLKFQATAAITANLLTTGKLETEIQKGPNNEIDILNKIEGLKSIYFSGQMGIGAEYTLGRKVSFILLPTAQFALNPINKSGVVKTFPYSFGVSAGLQLRF